MRKKYALEAQFQRGMICTSNMRRQTTRLISWLTTLGASVLAGVVSSAAAGAAMRFDGTGGILEVRSMPALELREEVTLEGWIRLERYEQPGRARGLPRVPATSSPRPRRARCAVSCPWLITGRRDGGG